MLAAGCLDGIDPQWQLNHDRIVVVRATPPHVRAGEVAMLDGLVAHKGAPTDLEQPLGAAVVTPQSLASAVSGISVTGPDDAALAAARGELGLAADAPVPLSVAMEFPSSNGRQLLATKIVWLGDTAANPAPPQITVDGSPPAQMIQIPIDRDVPLVADPTFHVNWLTSCGTMHDDDEPSAFVHVQPTDPKSGELVTVLRDDAGGVSWQVWPISAQ